MMERSEEDPSVVALVRDAISGVQDLVRVEVALAADDARRELRSAKRALLIAGVALVTILCALPLLMTALVLSLGGAAGALAAVGGGMLALGVLAGAIAARRMPATLLKETRARVEADVRNLQETIT